MSKQNHIHSTCAKDGGANQSKTTLPPPSDAYRNNWDEIFGKKKSTDEKVKETTTDKVGEDSQ